MNDPSQHLKSAIGYLDLGMAQDAWHEMEKLPPFLKGSEAVLDLKIEIFQKLGNWESARSLAESLAKRLPENLSWWLHWAYSVRREKSVEAARAVLLEAAIFHPNAGLIAYNLACYACVQGELETCRILLAQAYSLSESLKKVALFEADLIPIYGDKSAGTTISEITPPSPESDLI